MIPHFFIDRPIFASVLSIVIVVVGLVALQGLPIAQFPEITPPVVQIDADYPGASAEVIADSVARPIEVQLPGIDNLLYYDSTSTNDGHMTIKLTFEIGTNVDIAQVQTQNRQKLAEPRLPPEVVRQGISVKKVSPDLLAVVALSSSDPTKDTVFVSNYALLNVIDNLKRLRGVGDAVVFGGQNYSMRLILDPTRMAQLSLTPTDIANVVREQNRDFPAGTIGREPAPKGTELTIPVITQGRLTDVKDFEEMIVRALPDGSMIRLKDVAKIELGAQSYSLEGRWNGKPNVFLLTFLSPGANALDTVKRVRKEMDAVSKSFPQGVSYDIPYDTTKFIEVSIKEVVKTLAEAMVLVILVVYLFLQSWRATLIPGVAVPVSLIGTFAGMQALGFSINTLTLFGMVLAIGMVVDDAIVVVENVERNIARGLSPREAAIKSMDEVGAALIAIALVLTAVFVPSAFITGISGQFYRQFALTIAGATVISLIVSLTLSPALCALLLKPHDPRHRDTWWERPIHGFFRHFNRAFERLAQGYGWLAGRVVRIAVLMLVVYAGVLAFGLNEFRKTPVGFIPAVDGGYLIGVVQLPPGSSLTRTDAVNRKAVDIALQTPGVLGAVNIVGFSGATFTNAPNSGAIFLVLKPFSERAKDPNQSAAAIQRALFQKFIAIQEALVVVVAPPPVRGIGNAGGFRMMIEDRAGRGPQALQGVTFAMMGRAAQTPGVQQVFTLFETSTPQLYLDIDRTKAQLLGVNVTDVFAALQIYLGSAYVNDFNLFGRTFRVTAQADGDFRMDTRDVLKIRVRNSSGDTVPLGAFTTVRDISGPYRVPRYNLYPAAELDGTAAPGFSQGQAIEIMQQLAAQTLPEGYSFEWTTLAYQQLRAGNTAMFAFVLAVVFVFLVLAAQFESLTLPLAVILIVPMCLVASIVGVVLRGQDNNILTQVGFVVLIGLAAKNAILIVEFAKQIEDQGKDRFAAAVEAARLRFRPILMTSLSFIFGVAPLVWAGGAGAELRQTLGTAVFSGMIGVTAFGLIFTPVFYVVSRWVAVHLATRRQRTQTVKSAKK